jgi:integrase
MNTLLPVFLLQHVRLLKDVRNTESRINKYFGPLKSTPLKDITRLQILEWHNGIAEHSTSQADACLSILRTMYAKAQEWGLYEGENRAQYIKKRGRKPRKRFLHYEEMARLLAVLKTEPEWLQVYIEISNTCGPRPGEVRTIQWKDLEFFEADGEWQGRWTKPETKTTPHSIPIPPLLAARLSAMPRTCLYVFPGQCIHNHHTPISKTWIFEHWKRIRQAAGIPDVKLHDLRRSCATFLGAQGNNTSLIGKGVLNHTNLQTTSIYVQQMQAPVAKALKAHSEALRKMGGTQPPPSPTRRYLPTVQPTAAAPQPVFTEQPIPSGGMTPLPEEPSMEWEWPG